jgi:hypothetical protein
VGCMAHGGSSPLRRMESPAYGGAFFVVRRWLDRPVGRVGPLVGPSWSRARRQMRPPASRSAARRSRPRRAGTTPRGVRTPAFVVVITRCRADAAQARRLDGGGGPDAAPGQIRAHDRGFSASAPSVVTTSSTRRPKRSRAVLHARTLQTQPELPFRDTTHRSPSASKTFAGVGRRRPVPRPRTSSSGTPSISRRVARRHGRRR